MNHFDPNEFVAESPSAFNLHGALFSRLRADDLKKGEADRVLSLIQDLRDGKMDSYNPPACTCLYLISVLERYIEDTLKTIDTTNDYEFEAAVDVLAGHMALKEHYVKLTRPT